MLVFVVANLTDVIDIVLLRSTPTRRTTTRLFSSTTLRKLRKSSQSMILLLFVNIWLGFYPSQSRRAVILLLWGWTCVQSPQNTLIETWLILPVVIRSSQRLSHACLSISTYTVKLRMAHYISYSLFDSPYYLDNRSNSRANTCTKSWLLAERMYLLDINQWRLAVYWWITITWRIAVALSRRWIIQVSALSAFDGRVLAYHGVNG